MTKAWVSAQRVLNCVRSYLQGQRVGDKPIFDGICAHCGHLLYGPVNRNTASTGNKFTGQPRNMKGKPCSSEAQPPFLLRWPPQDLAEFAPDVFSWDESSNRLCLQEQHHAAPPWKATPHHRRTDNSSVWLYCKACHTQNTGAGAIPFRDSASLSRCVGLDLTAMRSQSSNLPEEFAHQEREWKDATARVAKKNPQRGGVLSFRNLVPVPDPRFWQSTPEAPFRHLTSEPARAALACCNLHSSMVEGQDERGRATYACVVGDTAIWRRQPHQLQATLAFMLCKDEGRLYRVPSAEFEDVRKCQLWLRQHNPHVRLLMTNLELFGQLLWAHSDARSAWS